MNVGSCCMGGVKIAGTLLALFSQGKQTFVEREFEHTLREFDRRKIQKRSGNNLQGRVVSLILLDFWLFRDFQAAPYGPTHGL